MFKQLADWLDDRSGYRHLMKEALDEPITRRRRWHYVFGSALTVIFMVQVFTGLLLMTSYSPSSSTAWGSVFFISHEMWGGWFVRGVHHFAAQAMVVLLVMHLLQVLLAGAYRRPRELNWWFGMALLFLTLGFSLTGYLLPWDQKGYWATKVATNIMGGRPASGPIFKKSSSVVRTTAIRRSLASTAFMSASCPCCSSCAWLHMSPSSGATESPRPPVPKRARSPPSGPSSSSWTRSQAPWSWAS